MSLTAVFAIAKGLAARWQYVVMAVLLGWGGLERMHYLDCKAGRAADREAHARALIEQAAIDRADNAKVVGQLTRQLADNETKVVTKIERVYAAPTTNACASSPAMRAATDSLRELFPGGQADSGRKPAAAVPGPAAGAR